MNNPIALITGGSSGLGSALATQMAAKGHNVLIVSRNLSELHNIADQINKAYESPRVFCFAADISTSSGVRSLFGHLSDENYFPTFLFNNAGVGPFFDLKAYKEEWIDRILATNLKGSMMMCAELMRFVGERQTTIINIISTLALKTMPQTEVYAASKWGLRGLTHSLQEQTKGSNIRVMGVYPGRFKSNFWPETIKENEAEELMDPESLARLILNNLLHDETVFVRELVLGRW